MSGRVIFILAMALVMQAAPSFADALQGNGEWQSLSGDSIKGKWAVSLVTAGSDVRGRLSLTGSNVFAGGEVSGTMEGGGIVLGVMLDGTKQATFQGKVDGDSISGEWQSDAAMDHGVWSGTLTKPEAQR